MDIEHIDWTEWKRNDELEVEAERARIIRENPMRYRSQEMRTSALGHSNGLIREALLVGEVPLEVLKCGRNEKLEGSDEYILGEFEKQQKSENVDWEKNLKCIKWMIEWWKKSKRAEYVKACESGEVYAEYIMPVVEGTDNLIEIVKAKVARIKAQFAL